MPILNYTTSIEVEKTAGQIQMIEERRQKLLELYEIGVQRFLYAKDDAKWFGVFRCHDDEYETASFKTRREAEDQAIAEYESISETGEK